MWEPVKLRLPEGDMFSEDMENFLGTQTELLQSALQELFDPAGWRHQQPGHSPR